MIPSFVFIDYLKRKLPKHTLGLCWIDQPISDRSGGRIAACGGRLLKNGCYQFRFSMLSGQRAQDIFSSIVNFCADRNLIVSKVVPDRMCEKVTIHFTLKTLK